MNEEAGGEDERWAGSEERELLLDLAQRLGCRLGVQNASWV
jgi:hypothetical protein